MLSVLLPDHHLRWQIVQSAAHCLAPEFRMITNRVKCWHIGERITPPLYRREKQKRKSRQESALLIRCVDTPSEICNLQLSIVADQQILWLDVSVDDFLLMAISKCVGHLEHKLKQDRFGALFFYL